jgi:uncharacterized peroxidase-related enzyme
MARIEIIEHEKAEGELKEIYDDLVQSRGKLACIHKIHSLNPESLVRHMDLYMTLLYGKSPVRRVHRELMGTVASRTNKCEYCTIHHAEAVNHYWKDEAKMKLLIEDYKLLSLSEKEMLFCQFAEELTLNPNSEKIQTIIDELKALGESDRAILDATQVVAYFNFVNRLVLGLDIKLEEDGGEGYKYD